MTHTSDPVYPIKPPASKVKRQQQVFKQASLHKLTPATQTHLLFIPLHLPVNAKKKLKLKPDVTLCFIMQQTAWRRISEGFLWKVNLSARLNVISANMHHDLTPVRGFIYFLQTSQAVGRWKGSEGEGGDAQMFCIQWGFCWFCVCDLQSVFYLIKVTELMVDRSIIW